MASGRSLSDEQPGVFWMGGDTCKVPMSLHAKNRERLMHAAREASKVGLVVLQGGKTPTRHATDHEPVFRQESFFHWAFGVAEPDCWGTIDLNVGYSTLFVPRLPEEYEIWMGEIKTLEYFKDKYQVNDVLYVDNLPSVLAAAESTYVLQGVNSDSGMQMSQPVLPIECKHNNLTWLFGTMSNLRVIKTAEEIDIMRYVSKISSNAHVEVMKQCGQGQFQFEYQMEAMFRYFCYRNGGCRHVGYTCICASGINSATLHYGHAAAANDCDLKVGQMCLLDMGAEYHCYGSDITCTYPYNGKFSEMQEKIYRAVLDANRQIISQVKPGVAWEEMHRLGERIVLGHLVDIGFVSGSIDEMVDRRIGALFQPHGLGHLIGIDTHDVGGYMESDPKCPPRLPGPGLASLRTRRRLEAGMTVTVEPGCYFIRPVLLKALLDESTRPFLVEDRLADMMADGWGVRIEDVVLVTNDGAELLSDVPREPREIERIMAGN